VELRRGFASEAEAREAAVRALKNIRSVAYPKTETLTVVTGADPNKTKAEASGIPLIPRRGGL